MSRRGKIRSLAICLLVTLVSGCGGLYDSSVTGKVTLDGNSIARGTVSYHPVQQGPTAYGLVGEDGTYLVRVGREEGLPAGEYLVSIVANAESTPNKNPSLPPMPGKPITPRWYRTTKTSGLTFTVEAGSNEIDLELTTEPPPNWKPPKRRRR